MQIFRAALCAAIVLPAGCAAPKQALPDSDYRSYASTWVIMSKCGATGQLDPETAFQGMDYLDSNLSQFTYDIARMQSAVATLSVHAPTKEQCNEAAMLVHTRKRQVAAHNAAVAADQKAREDIAKSNQTRQVDCHQVGTQTVCSTR